MDTGARAGSDARVRGIDIARAIAIVGMIAVHVGPTGQTDLAGRLYATPFGRASLLFVLVAGVGVTLLARSRRATSTSARVTLLWRAALLLPAGIALQQLDHDVNVILQAYALLFVVAALAVTLSDRWLAGVAGAAFLVGPVVYWVGQAASPHLYDRNGDVSTAVPDVLHALVLSGPYPVVTWVAPLLLGMWLGRQDLTHPSWHRRLVVVGGGVALASLLLSELLPRLAGGAATDPTSPWHLTLGVAHSQMPFWLIGGTGAATAVLGLALWADARAGGWLWPLAATGQLALTIYVAHVVSLYLAPDLLRSGDVGQAVVIVAGSTVVAAVFATLWRARARRGPLELLLRAPTRLTAPQ